MSGIPNQRGLILPALVLLAACGSVGAPAARARVDTLPSGIVQVTSEAPTAWADSAHAWRFKITLRIQPDDGSPGELMEPGTIGVDDWGRVYVSDRKPAQIKVFDSTGAFMRTIGREGGGPGEYRVAFIAVRGSQLSDVPPTAPAFQTLRVDLDGNTWARHLVGSDSTRTRYDVFSPAGAWLGPVTVPVAVPEYGGQFFGRKAIYSTVEDADGRPAIVRVQVEN